MTSIHLSSYNNSIMGSMMRAPLQPQRPSTPSFRIVSSPAVNPSPAEVQDLELEDEDEDLFEDILSPKKIRSLSGHTDLSQIISLDLVVDTTESSLGSFGNYLPNIRELRLTGSKITTVRDLGTSLHTLEVLWMSRCGLQDLDGICSVGQLKELYLSYNEITELSPLSMIDTLQLVDIDSNNVTSLEQVEFLCMCPELTTLNIEWNPLTMEMAPADLRKEIKRILPNLKYLDDQCLATSGTAKGGKTQSLSTREHRLLGNTGNLQSEIRVVNSALKESITEDRNRPKSAKSRIEPSEDRESETSSPTPGPDHSSGLTQGVVICGPPSKLLTKMSRTVKENILNRAMDRASSSSPPHLMAAWSDKPDDMLQEWRDSRDWLSRELTMNILNENKDQGEKQANFEAALQDSTQRLGSPRTRLTRPTQRSAGHCSPHSLASSAGHCSPHSLASSPLYDECFEVETSNTRASPKITRRKSDARTERVRPGFERTTAPESDSKKERNRPSFERAATLENSASKSADFSKSKSRRSSKSTTKSYDSASLKSPTIRTTRSPTELVAGGPVRATYRPKPDPVGSSGGEVTDKMHRYNKLPSPPSSAGCKPTPPGGPPTNCKPTPPMPTPPGSHGKALSSRLRRMKVSIEDQVAQQSAVDVLYSDKMPRPSLTRHART